MLQPVLLHVSQSMKHTSLVAIGECATLLTLQEQHMADMIRLTPHLVNQYLTILHHICCGNSSRTLVVHMHHHMQWKLALITLLAIKAVWPLVQHKATYVRMECKTCHTVRTVTCKPGFGGAMIPRTCDAATVGGQGNTCGQDPFTILPNKTQFVDQQQLKLQVRYKPCSPGICAWRAVGGKAGVHIVFSFLVMGRGSKLHVYKPCKHDQGFAMVHVHQSYLHALVLLGQHAIIHLLAGKQWQQIHV